MLMRRPSGTPGKVLLELFSDTDFAGCKETRRAMTCGVTRLDKTAISVFARRQGVQSTSSGEAEFYGSTSVVMDGRIIKRFLEWLGYDVAYQLFLDSSAAKAMVQRDGVGKLKHMDVRALWIQTERRDHGLVTRKVPGAQNYADLGTKAYPPGRFLELRDMLNIVDCNEIDDEKEIEACSVQATCEVGPRPQMTEIAAKLERKLLLALLAGAPAIGSAENMGATAVAGFDWTGWLDAFVVTMIFVVKLVAENFEVHRRRPALDAETEVPLLRPSAPPHDFVDHGHEGKPEHTTRDVLVQGPVTYKTRSRLDGTHGRYTPLAERDFDAWAAD
jgi:hypothetical protein